MNAKNILKAFAISVVVNALYIFHISSSSFVAQGASIGLDKSAGRLEAFIQASKMINGFWPRIVEGWAYSFGLCFISCLLLLLAIKQRTDSKSDVHTASDG